MLALNKPDLHDFNKPELPIVFAPRERKDEYIMQRGKDSPSESPIIDK